MLIFLSCPCFPSLLVEPRPAAVAVVCTLGRKLLPIRLLYTRLDKHPSSLSVSPTLSLRCGLKGGGQGKSWGV